MTALQGSYLVAPTIVHETIDGETIILNPTRGWYYSLERAGAEIWSWLHQGASPAEIIGLLTAKYAAARDELIAAVQGLVTTLEAEGLIVGRYPDGEQLLAAVPIGAPSMAAPVPFVVPTLEKHTDLEGLVMASATILGGKGAAADQRPLHIVAEQPNREPWNERVWAAD